MGISSLACNSAAREVDESIHGTAVSLECSCRGEPAIQVVVSNAPSCGGMQFAAAAGIPTLQYPGRKDDPHALSPEDLVRALKEEHGVDIVCLAGYMKVSPRALGGDFSVSQLHLHRCPGASFLPAASCPSHELGCALAAHLACDCCYMNLCARCGGKPAVLKIFAHIILAYSPLHSWPDDTFLELWESCTCHFAAIQNMAVMPI